MFSRCPDLRRPARERTDSARRSPARERRDFPRRRQTLAALLLALLSIPFASAADPAPRLLRVADDPNNLPFSNSAREGFENKLVDLIARDLGATVEYTWHAQRRGFFRETLKDAHCDLVPGVPHDFERTLNTAPYYRSSYTFVSRRAQHLDLHSLDDPQLRSLRIGVQMIGDDFSNTPPAHALSRRGLIANVRGYTLYGDYSQPNPPARILDALLDGEIDVALVWGPLAGFYAKQHAPLLALTALPPTDELTHLPFAFEISVGVNRRDRALRDEVDAILVRRRPEIDALLADYGVPLLAPPSPPAATPPSPLAVARPSPAVVAPPSSPALTATSRPAVSRSLR